MEYQFLNMWNKTNAKIHWITVLSIVLFSICGACRHTDEREPETKIDNEEVFKTVLKFYAEPEDSLKRKAAVFLFTNMNLHSENRIIADKRFNDVLLQIDTLRHYQTKLTTDDIKAITKNILARYGRPDIAGVKPVADTEIVTADYIINNIELAFSSLQANPWSNSVNFVDFCEYILPYRILHERVEIWRPKIYNQYYENRTAKQRSMDLQQTYKYVFDSLDSDFLLDQVIYDAYPFKQSIGDLLKGRTGVCLDACMYKTSVMRSIGLPVALDEIPHWGNISSGHFMIKLIAPTASNKLMTNENLPITTRDVVDVSSAIESNMMKVFTKDDLPEGLYVQYVKTVPKVYRHVFSKQKEMDSLVNHSQADEVIPGAMALNIKDVTDQYVSCADVTITLDEEFKSKSLAYLCLFDVDEWKPVAFSLAKAGKTFFKKMGKNIIYLPCVLSDYTLLPAGKPFSIDQQGNIKIIEPHPKEKESVKILRKYPLFAYTAFHTQKLYGGKFEGSDSSNFSNAFSLYDVNYYPFYWNEVNINTSRPYRYLRFVPPSGYMASLAELEFIDRNGNVLPGVPIGIKGLAGHEIEKTFDHNMDSYYESSDYFGGWIGIDLGPGNKTIPTKIRFCPRNDTNCIVVGNSYELFYWDSKWISLGRQTATKSYLSYDGVPKNSLLWLKCHSGGKEERIFTYEGGRQLWW